MTEHRPTTDCRLRRQLRRRGLRDGRRLRRSGYALLLVMVFIALFLAMLGVTWRRVASALRVASAHSVQAQHDEGCLLAMAMAMRLLETGLPPTQPTYSCGTTLSTQKGSRSYTVTFTLQEDTTWTVAVRPTQSGESPQPMPDSFAPSNP